MINAVRRLYSFSNQCPLDCLRPDARRCSEKTPLPTGGDTPAKPMRYRSILPQDRTVKDWTRIAWPTNTQSRTPDGQFGPAKQMQGWGDCWFLAAMGAVANDEDGRQILADSIKQVTEQGIRGYAVTFKGSPDNTVFISERMLNRCVDANGGDADTRLLELAADRFFAGKGRFVSLSIAAFMNAGMDQFQAAQCVDQMCQSNGIQNPNRYNPMRHGAYDSLAFFLLTGIYPDVLWVIGDSTVRSPDIIAYLDRYTTKSRDGASISLAGKENPLGNTDDAILLLQRWDVIRTEITSNGTVDTKEQAFLNALDRWLETPLDTNWLALRSAAENLTLQHVRPEEFLVLLGDAQIALRPHHRTILRSGVQEVLGGGLGHIGFPGEHSVTIERIDAAHSSFTYSNPNYPTLVHTGELSSLIQAIANGHVELTAMGAVTGQDGAESSSAGEKRGRHLLTFHQQAVKDGKIDPAESGPLANLMEMDDRSFRHVYDSDDNGMIDGSELSAVQLRVDRWVNHLTLTPIW